MPDQVQEVVGEVKDTQIEAVTDNTAQAATPTEGEQTEDSAQAREAKTFTQEEVDRIAQKERAKAERKATREFEAKLDAIAKQQKVEPSQEVKSKSAPRIEDFKDVEEYLNARDQWRDEVRAEQESIKRAELTQREMLSKTEKLYAKAEKIDGFDRDVFDSVITPAMASSILESDVAPQVMAYLSQNPDEAERISELKPSRQAAEIVKIEEELTSKKPVAVSKAPAPIKPVGSRGGAPSGDPEKMSQAQYEEYRAKQGATWAKR